MYFCLPIPEYFTVTAYTFDHEPSPERVPFLDGQVSSGMTFGHEPSPERIAIGQVSSGMTRPGKHPTVRL